MREILDLIKKHEGYEPMVYQCSEGFDTIGIGFKVDNLFLSEEVCDIILEEKIDKILERLDRLTPWVEDLPSDAQMVLINMCYQMGVGGVMKFKKALAAMKVRNWEEAAKEMLDSKWARQTPGRANELSEIIKNIND